MDDNDLFDDDDALDCVIFDEVSNSERNEDNSGCFSMFIFIAIPSGICGIATYYLC